MTTSSSESGDGAFTASEARQAKRLGMVLALISVFFVVEVGGAFLAESNVLKADALHLLMDVFALAMSLVAMRLAVQRPTPRFTFGLRRAEPVAAMFNGFLVLAATVEIVRDGITELHEGHRPAAGKMLVVSAFALVVNGLSAWLLHDVIGHAHGHAHGEGHGEGHGHEDGHGHGDRHGHAATETAHAAPRGHHLNLKSARLHLLGDTLGSLAALVAAVVIQLGGPASVDPIASFVVAAILLVGAVGILRDAILVLLEAAPPHLPVAKVRAAVAAFDGVGEIHDLHVWTLGAGHDAVSVHVHSAAHDGDLAAKLSKHLRESFEVEYVTVQVETAHDDCAAPPSRYAAAVAE